MHVNGGDLSPLVQRRLFLSDAGQEGRCPLSPLPGQSNKKRVVFTAMLHLRLYVCVYGVCMYVCARSRISQGASPILGQMLLVVSRSR